MQYSLLKLKRLSLQLLLLLAFYFISRCIFTLINHSHFPGLSIGRFLRIAFYATRFDISAISILNILYIFLFFLPVNIDGKPGWEKFTQFIFIAVNSLAFMFEISDWTYFPFTLKRATSDVLNMVTRKGDFLFLLPHLITDYWYIPLSCIASVAGLIFFNKQIKKATPLQQKGESQSWSYKGIQLMIIATLGGLAVISIRGGLGLVPIGIRDATKVDDAEFVPVTLNTPFSIINTLYANRLQELHYMDEQEAYKYISPVKQYPHDTFNKKNVVIIILESFSKEYTLLGKSHGYTPFLDSLMGVSCNFTNAYANASHSIEGIPAILAGIPALTTEPFSTSIYSTNKITALPALLKKEGYTSAFYHGATNGSMSFDAFCASAGFDKYYGRTEYNNEADYDGSWGISDEPFLRYFARGISKMHEPFLATVFTLSSHDPYIVPEKYRNVLPKGKIPIESTIAYTDMALRNFFAIAASKPWYKNTLFVISADHGAMMHEDNFYTQSMPGYGIPILFFAPGDTLLRGSDSTLMQQINILPSILDYLGYSKPFFALGNSMFSENQPFTVNSLNGKTQLLLNGYLLQTSDMDPIALYHYAPDSTCSNNLFSSEKDIVNSETKYLQALMQIYNASIINNKMWVKP